MLIRQGVIYFSVKLTKWKDNEFFKNVLCALASSAIWNRSRIKCEVIYVSMYTCLNRAWPDFYVSAVSSEENQAEVKSDPKNQLFFPHTGIHSRWHESHSFISELTLPWMKTESELQSVLTLVSMQPGWLEFIFRAELGQILIWQNSLYLCAVSPTEELLNAV